MTCSEVITRLVTPQMSSSTSYHKLIDPYDTENMVKEKNLVLFGGERQVPFDKHSFRTSLIFPQRLESRELDSK